MLTNCLGLGLLVFVLVELIRSESLSSLKSTTIGPDDRSKASVNPVSATARVPTEREKEFLIKLVAAIEQSPGPTFNETSSYNRSFRNTIIVLVSSVVLFVVVATLMIVKCWKNDRRQRAYKRAALGAGPATTLSNCDNSEEMKTF